MYIPTEIICLLLCASADRELIAAEPLANSKGYITFDAFTYS